MSAKSCKNRTFDPSRFENATIGDGAFIDPDVSVGYRYHPMCGASSIGKHCVLRKGTVIYGDVIIGNHFHAAHYVVIRALVKMGDYCTMLNHSTIEGIVRLGTGVRIMTNVYISSRTWIGDHVFIGPGTTFLNGKYPGRREETRPPKGATVGDDVMIGGGTTILPEITIGEKSFIAAGAVVTKDVPPNSFVAGVPGHITPLPDSLNQPNHRSLTIQTQSMWHPNGEFDGEGLWPEYWNEKFRDSSGSD